MRLIGSTIVSADTLSQLFGGKQAIGLDHVALAVDPFGFNRVEPGALCRQQKGQDMHACARQLDEARLCWRIQVRTAWLLCQEALSQIKSQWVLPPLSRP